MGRAQACHCSSSASQNQLPHLGQCTSASPVQRSPKRETPKVRTGQVENVPSVPVVPIRHLLLATLRIKAGFMALSAPSAPSLDAESATPTIRLVSRTLSTSATPSVSNAKLIPA
jgi:hypothetical protein